VKGAILIDELVMPIVEIYIEDGAFVMVAEIVGPVPAGASTSYAIHGRDGREVYVSVGPMLSWPEITAGMSLTLQVKGVPGSRRLTHDPDD
jgi:hypothetical protein